MFAAVLLASAGVAGAVVGATMLARGDARQSRSGLRLAAQEVASNLRLRIEKENDLLVASATFFKEAPAVDPARFRAWVSDVEAYERYPELAGIADIVLVPGDRLARWQAHATSHPPIAGPPRRFSLFPPGTRSHYCMTAASVTKLPSILGLDSCAVAPQLYASRSTGVTYDSVIALTPVNRFLGASMPVYRGGSDPRTTADRRARFIGWTAMIVHPQVILAQALVAHPGLRVVLRNTQPPGMSFTAGTAQPGAPSYTIGLGGNANVTVSGAVASAGILANSNALLLFVCGVLVAVSLAALLFALGTGRTRAVRLVAEKTSELSFRALHDDLTQLPNRALVLDRTAHALALAARSGVSVVALFIDVDGFKTVNDTFGHAAGDELLRVLAGRLRDAVRDGDTVGRFGGDEFVVVLETDEPGESPDLVAERMLQVVRQPVHVTPGQDVLISASIGVATGRDGIADELLRNADLAMYAAKGAGKNRYAVFEDAMQTAAAYRSALELDLQGALDAEQLSLAYQPMFHLRSGRVNRLEALIRWEHPTRGTISPAEFIPLAESNGLIVEIGRWVLEQACRRAAIWQASGFPVGVSVNVSAPQLDRDEFLDEVVEALRQARLGAGSLTLEITETLLMRDPDAAARRLHALKRLGVRIAIDDFGTGYSSLAYLRQFPVDELKIDRSFVSGIAGSTEAAALMHTLIQLGRTLGIETLGEGIEDPWQLARLRNEHCDSGQGFLLARPLPADDVEAFLKNRDQATERSRERTGKLDPSTV